MRTRGTPHIPAFKRLALAVMGLVMVFYMHVASDNPRILMSHTSHYPFTFLVLLSAHLSPFRLFLSARPTPTNLDIWESTQSISLLGSALFF